MQSILVVISGSGTNLQAIIDACNQGAVQARICSVISNVPDVYGLERAQNAGIETLTLDHKAHASREVYDQALAAAIDKARARPDCAGRFYAHSDHGIC